MGTPYFFCATTISSHQEAGNRSFLHYWSEKDGTSISSHQAAGNQSFLHYWSEKDGTTISSHQASGNQSFLHYWSEKDGTTIRKPSGTREPVIPSLLVRKGWNHHQQPSGTREPVIPSLLVRKGWNHHQQPSGSREPVIPSLLVRTSATTISSHQEAGNRSFLHYWSGKDGTTIRKPSGTREPVIPSLLVRKGWNHHQQPSGSREPVIPSLLVRTSATTISSHQEAGNQSFLHYWSEKDGTTIRKPSGTREPVIPSLLVRKGWNHHQEAIRNPGTGHSFTTGQKRMEPPSAAIRQPGTSHSFTTGQNQCNHHQQPSGSREPVIPSLLVRKGWNHHQEAIWNPGTGPLMPATISVVDQISGRNIRLTQARETIFNNLTGR